MGEGGAKRVSSQTHVCVPDSRLNVALSRIRCPLDSFLCVCMCMCVLNLSIFVELHLRRQRLTALFGVLYKDIYGISCLYLLTAQRIPGAPVQNM